MRLVGTGRSVGRYGVGEECVVGSGCEQAASVAGLIRRISRIAIADRNISLSTIVAWSSNRLPLLVISPVTIQAVGVSLLRSWD